MTTEMYESHGLTNYPPVPDSVVEKIHNAIAGLRDIGETYRILQLAREAFEVDKSDLTKYVEDSWRGRVNTQGYSPNGVRTRKAEVEFFAGAMCVIQAIYPREDGKMSAHVPVSWVIHAMSGRPIVDLKTFPGVSAKK